MRTRLLLRAILAIIVLAGASADAADELKVGDPAPLFTAKTHDGSDFDLASRKGQWTVLYFYPKAGTPGCTKQADAFRDNIKAIRDQGAEVYGISTDTFFALKAFSDQQKYNFPLLSDFNKQVIRDYGVFNEDMIGLKGISKRAVFVLDKDGVVRHKEVLEDARNEPNYQKVHDTLAALG